MGRILICQVLLLAPDLLDRFRRGVVVAHLELTGWNEHELHRNTLTKVQRELPDNRRIPRRFVKRRAFFRILPKRYLRSG